MSKIEDLGSENEIQIPTNINASVRIVGNHNKVYISNGVAGSSIFIDVRGDQNSIRILKGSSIKGLRIYCGNHVPAHNVELSIGENFSIEPNGKFFLYNSGGSVSIGRNCMFSNNVTVRCGESPHLIFDKSTGSYLDTPRALILGDHVWIGENSYITKSAGIADENIVGACSVVTRRFEERNCVIAGNPAQVVKRNVQWIRNRNALEEGSHYRESIQSYDAQYPKSE